MKNKSRNLFLYCGMIFAAILFVFINTNKTLAEDTPPLNISITTSNGASSESILDDSYNTYSEFNSGDTITISSTENISGLYIIWNNKDVGKWTLSNDSNTKQCGTYGYLHEYVNVDFPSTTLTMNIENDGMKICKLFAFSAENKPSWVQDWSDPCDNADILLVSTHADDEQLFFGGIIPYYAGELKLKVEVAYFCNFWNSAPIREHEKLDGLWTVGVRNYPVNGNFDDIYATSLEAAKQVYNYNDSVSYIVELIRRFKPLVLVGQDLNGEYGHGGHMLTAAAITDAIELSSNASEYPDSADIYGTYDVPKTYLHLYPENQINLDCSRKLDAFGGKTVLEVASEGYLQHASQQWCWFYVSDSYEYSCAKFGLYRSKVGTDTNNDIMENVISYEEQESIAESEAASKKAEEESIEAEKASESESIKQSEEASAEAPKEADAKSHALRLVIIVILSVLILFFIIFLIALTKGNKKKKRKKRKIK